MIAKKYFLLSFLTIATLWNGYSQTLFSLEQQEFVKWTFENHKLQGNEFELSFKASISEGYYMYSMDKTEGPLPLQFDFVDGNYELLGNMSANCKSKEKFDEGFGINVKYYDGEVVFKQKIKASGKTTISGTVSYQACSDQQCVPGNADFSFSVEGDAAEAPIGASVQPAQKSDNSLIGFFMIAFFMGLLGVLTPCVFPMIPMTVSFFMSGSNNRAIIVSKGLIFGLSVTLIYTLVGLLVAFTQNEAFAGVLSSHWIPNLLFFILFIGFALWFFGLFEISLPAGLANRTDQQVDKGGYLASFFLAATLAIVSFSCTGPFVGAILVQSARGGIALQPILGMFGFGLGLGLPFIIFAFMPALMKKLPKSGGWLNSVKMVFAFVLLAMSLKFLDIVDNYFGWNLLTRDVVIAIWIAIALVLGFYLLGKIRLPHDSEPKQVGIIRLLLAIAVFSFAVYLVPGLFGAPLSAVSAFIPAQEKQVFDLTSTGGGNGGGSSSNKISINVDNLCGTPQYSDFLTLPKGIAGYFDFNEGLACAKEKNKPVLLDFKGHNCSNCKKMEKGIFRDQRIIDLLNSRFVVIGLYTDDKTRAPASEHRIATNGKRLETIGEINLNRQASNFGLAAQPYFVIVDAEGNPLSKGIGYETDADRFLQWLTSSIQGKY
ncbi:MAG: DUF255 domain-containing protein [Prevotellaceae bacterium]|jgi:thiol:disulfide interchange protein DsbD|nr:DUF255 domain-containing protein [Prevotellaceae bacterium]